MDEWVRISWEETFEIIADEVKYVEKTHDKKNGTQFVFVGPEYNSTAARFNAKWIRVRPGTDTAFLLAVAYEMFKLDEAEGRGTVID